MTNLKSTVTAGLAFVLATFSAPTLSSANEGVLVFGGTGQLGKEVVMDLVEAGEDVTVFVRPTSNRSELETMGVSFVTGDVLTESDVEAALKSGPYKVVIDALARDGDVNPDFYIDSMIYMAKWAKETGVAQFILHGSVGAGLSRPIYPEDNWSRMGNTITAKDFGERHLMESGVPYTIIRNLVLLPADLKESGKAAITTDQTKRGGVTRDALARLTLECMGQDRCLNEIFHAYDDEVEVPEGRYRDTLDEFKRMEQAAQ
ncbi:MAG: NAD(P)H-binding protein [Rhodospirillaceae bacterium]